MKRKRYIIFIENNLANIDSIYNLDKPEYSKYTKVNDTVYYNKRYNKTLSLNDTILNYPFVNINNDTTTILKEKGWLLSDCWYRACPVCFHFFDQIHQEQQQNNGKSILESKGIKILSINPYAADINRLKEDAVKYRCEKYFYGAKHLNYYMNMHRMPQFYLISPDKKIIYSHTGLLSTKQYIEILEILKNYETKD